jgi:hypothetical protein
MVSFSGPKTASVDSGTTAVGSSLAGAAAEAPERRLCFLSNHPRRHYRTIIDFRHRQLYLQALPILLGKRKSFCCFGLDEFLLAFLIHLVRVSAALCFL